MPQYQPFLALSAPTLVVRSRGRSIALRNKYGLPEMNITEIDGKSPPSSVKTCLVDQELFSVYERE